MRKLITLPILLVWVMLALMAFADSAPLRIGVVDTEVVFEAYDEAEGISEKVRAIAESGIEERLRIREGANLLEKEIREKAEQLSEDEIQRLREKLQQKVQQYIDFDREQKKREAEPVHRALEYIYEKSEIYGETNGYDLILEKRTGVFGRTVLFYAEELDITEKIVELL